MIPLLVLGGVLAQDTVITSFLKTVDVPSGHIATVYKADRRFEAPNWSRDGRFFVINSEGRLYRLRVGAQQLEPIETGAATRINNDHGISPDGKSLVISAEPTGRISADQMEALRREMQARLPDPDQGDFLPL